MNKEQYHLIKHGFTFTLIFLGLINYSVLGLAQPTSPIEQSSNQIKIRFQQQDSDGSSRGRPGRRGGTGSRGDCPPVDLQLTALIPSSNLGSFVEAHPTLWFYIPYKSSEVTTAEFSLQDEQNNDVYRTNFTLPNTPGTVSLSLAQAPPLEINKKYQWYVKVYCSQQKLSAPVFIRGWVERVALKPELAKQLQTATTPRERVAFYAQNGIWYSALTELAKLRIAQPQNATVNNDWASLLRDVGLENLVQKPVAGEVNLHKK
ncbi:hypothetical protein NIES2119_25555 [[Phormidium ambiguum] IAM M-71]|uniref:DUF928 domain-containing protein n=1 Tax=[Phormidium ambiguum] IAM M-71 TaxID=454136 RepID=A0A1U7I8C3_9CYAN|nr:DUF928 domain-containing protein [Phormidium ambiguum]OKH32651.1 hypothetical protein NIES2119_25555 [Phormidium ambiguum IAM M-71]